MFDQNKSKNFRKLSELCPDLSVGSNSRKEMFCKGVCNCKGEKVVVFVKSLPDKFEESLQLAIQVFQIPDEYEAKAKKAIANDFLEVFNEDWNMKDSNIDEEEFINNLTLSGISAYYGSVIGLDFRENGMFGSHILGANSLNKGKTFTETNM